MPMDIESSAVQTHIATLQGIIARMSQLSTHSKTWCITLVAALFVITTNLDENATLWVSILPIVLFLVMDMQYLALERRFRDIYDEFVSNLHAGNISEGSIFVIKPWSNWKDMTCQFFKAFISFAIFPFYGLLIFVIALIESIWG
jgi:hypothetical protein